MKFIGGFLLLTIPIWSECDGAAIHTPTNRDSSGRSTEDSQKPVLHQSFLSESSPSSILDGTIDEFLIEARQSSRQFILIIRTRSEGWFPVVFDTGSGELWLASQDLTMRKRSDSPGYPEKHSTRCTDSTILKYLTGTTICSLWVDETLGVGPNIKWNSRICVAKETALTINSISGVLGADQSSTFTTTHGIFWILPVLYPKMGLVVGDRLNPGKVCNDNDMTLINVIHRRKWMIDSKISINFGEPLGFPARLDTGSQRLYLPDRLWEEFNSYLSSIGILLKQESPSSDFYIENCNNFAELPDINIAFGDFKIVLDPTQYVRIFKKGANIVCLIRISTMPGLDEVLVGAPVLTRIVTRWDSFSKTIGVCHPKSKAEPLHV
jgi:hypothetical protein